MTEYSLHTKVDLENGSPAFAKPVLEAAVKSEWDLRKFFEQMRFDKKHHLGMGDIRLTMGQQEEICELVERFYRCR